MPNFRLYSTVTTSNATVGSVTFAEGQLPSTVNNSLRQLAADLKTTYNELPWYDIGDTPTRTGNTTFTVPVDRTTILTADRRLKLADSTTLYASVVSSSFGSGVTTVTVKVDGGTALSASLSTVHYSVEGDTNESAPADFGRKGYATTGGTSTAYTATFTPPVPALVNGVRVAVKLNATCGATPTFAPDSLTAKTMVLPGNVAIAANDLTANSVLDLVYDSTLDKWVIEGYPGGTGSLNLPTITALGGI